MSTHQKIRITVKRQPRDWEKIFAIHIQQRTHPELKKILKINFKNQAWEKNKYINRQAALHCMKSKPKHAFNTH